MRARASDGHDVEDERDTADDAFARGRFGFEDGGESCCPLISLSLLVSRRDQGSVVTSHPVHKGWQRDTIQQLNGYILPAFWGQFSMSDSQEPDVGGGAAARERLRSEGPQPTGGGVRAGVLVFSSDAAHRSPDVMLSDDCDSAVLADFAGCGWVRCERGADAGYSTMRWAVKLGPDDGGNVFVIGVVSEDFVDYSMSPGEDLKQLWMFQNEGMCADGNRSSLSPCCFNKCDIVTLELERRPGVDSVLRARVKGRTPQEMRGLPESGVLYPIVCVVNDRQRLTMVPPPKQ